MQAGKRIDVVGASKDNYRMTRSWEWPSCADVIHNSNEHIQKHETAWGWVVFGWNLVIEKIVVDINET